VGLRAINKLVPVAICLALTACASPAADRTPRGPGGPKGTIVVGVSGAFTESRLVAEIYAQVLERAGYQVQRQFDLRSREISQNALESGQIDLKPEYLSSLLLFLQPNAQASTDPAAVAKQDRELLGPRGITVLKPSAARDTNEFVANARTARQLHLTTLSALASVAGRLNFGGPPECAQRPLCLPGLYKVYGILFNDFDALDAGGPLTVAALKSDKVQVALLFSTDPSIRANRFVPLFDDKHLQNAENITPVIRSDRLNPEIRGLLDAVSGRLTTGTVRKLLGEVGELGAGGAGGRSVAAVARAFLAANGPA
jgi:osmoprotectant transport system substrate-binding protein